MNTHPATYVELTKAQTDLVFKARGDILNAVKALNLLTKDGIDVRFSIGPDGSGGTALVSFVVEKRVPIMVEFDK